MKELNYVFPHRARMPLVIAYATVIPMDTEYQLHDQTVVVENGWIKSIGQAGNFPATSLSVIPRKWHE
jgi:hypothetical protein